HFRWLPRLDRARSWQVGHRCGVLRLHDAARDLPKPSHILSGEAQTDLLLERPLLRVAVARELSRLRRCRPQELEAFDVGAPDALKARVGVPHLRTREDRWANGHGLFADRT